MLFPMCPWLNLSYSVFSIQSSLACLTCGISSSLNREIKFDVTWSCVKRQTAKMTSEFVFFSSNPSLNHIKIEKCLLLIATNTNIFTLLFNELKTEGKSFIFAVCRLTYDHVTSNLISLKNLSDVADLTTATGNVTILSRHHCTCTTRCDLTLP